MTAPRSAELTLPVEITYLPAIKAFVDQLARIAGLGDQESNLFLVAVEEAVTNVIDHAFLPGEEADFKVICETTPLEFIVRVRDRGLPFDPDHAADFTGESDLENAAGKGLGLRLMKGLVDRIDFSNLGYDGKEVVLTRYIHQRHTRDLFRDDQLAEFRGMSAQPEQPAVCLPLEVDFLQAHQAIEVAQCAYRTYGYTYIMENVYYPDRLFEMTQTGDLISFVAKCAATGDVIGHCALEFCRRKHGVPELGMAFVKPEYRGMGALNHLSEFMVSHARRTDLSCMYAKAVTTHPYSQMALHRIGFQPNGILVGQSPPKTFSQMDKNTGQRETLVLCHRNVGVPSNVEIYPPADHRNIINRIFESLDIPIIERDADSSLPAESPCRLEIEVNQRPAMATITVLEYGLDFRRVISQRLREICRNKIEAICIYLDMTDRHTPAAVLVLEKLQFFFAGVFPADQRHYLLFQYLNHVPLDYDRIVIHHPFAVELLEYIKSRDPNLV